MEIKGFTYGYAGRRGDFRSEEGIRSQELLYQTGINWMCLTIVVEQETAMSTQICFDFEKSCSDRDIMAAVKRAHDRGIKVCLKPMVNCADGVWRAYIKFPDTDIDGKDLYWDAWFESYGKFMEYYAQLAEETGCEMLCIGCEMCGTERKEAHWRSLIAKVRATYSGKLIYNTNHGHEDDIRWFDGVDYIGTSAYFPVAKQGDASKETMVREWTRIRDNMKKLYERWHKQIVFIEIGCRSAKGCASMPWDYSHKDLPHDEDEQAAFYDSCLEVFGEQEWFAGLFWWDWGTFIYDTAKEALLDHGFNIHLKKAEQVLKDWYRKL